MLQGVTMASGTLRQRIAKNVGQLRLLARCATHNGRKQGSARHGWPLAESGAPKLCRTCAPRKRAGEAGSVARLGAVEAG